MIARTSRRAVRWIVIAAACLPATGAQAFERWSFGASTRSTYSDNVLLRYAGDAGDFSTDTGLSLAYTRTDARLGLSAAAWSAGTVFADLNDLSSGQFGIGAAASRRMSRRLVLRQNDAVSRGLNLEDVSVTGVQLPQIRVTTAQNDTGASFFLDPKTTATADLGLAWSRLRANQPIDGSQIVLGTTPFDTGTPRDPAVPSLPDPTRDLIERLISEGLDIADFDARTIGGSVGLEHAFSERTTASMSGGYGYTHFDQATLTSGATFQGHAALHYHWRRSTTFGLSYTELHNEAQPTPVTTRTAFVEADHRWSARVQIQSSLGASVLDPAGVEPASTALVGGLGLSWRARRTSLRLRYDRTVYSAVGFSRSRLSDSLVLSVSHRLGRKLTFSSYAALRFGSDVFDRDVSFTTAVASISGQYAIGRHVSVGADYAFRDLARSGFATIRSSLVSGFITYGRSWK